MSKKELCGCCAGIVHLTPGNEANPPGQDVLSYRVGSHGRFVETQIAAVAAKPALQRLTTRETDDPSLALLDAWSAVLDVLSFYQERIVNEGFLRTATERRSVLELARAIGYELRPGVAASTFLAFTLESAAGAPATARIDRGTKAQSVPRQDEQAQIFETLEPVQARPAWNALTVVRDEDALPRFGGRVLYLKGQNTRLQPGDALLIVGDERLKDPSNENWDFRAVVAVQVVPPAEPSADPLAGYTVVTLDHSLGRMVPHVQPATLNARCFALRSKAALFGQAAPDWRAMHKSVRASYLGFNDENQALISLYPEWPGFTLADISDPPTGTASGTGLYAEYFEGIDFKTRKLTRTDAAVNFDWGAGSPDQALSADTFSVRWTGWLQIPEIGTYTFFARADDGVRLWVDGHLIINEWRDQGAKEFSATVVGLQRGRKVDIRLDYYENTGAAVIQLSWSGPGIGKQIIPTARLYPRDVHSVHLDASYPRLTTGSWIVLSIPEYQEVYRILDQKEDGRSAFTLSAKTTKLKLRGEQLRELFNERLRDTAVYGESVELPWAKRPLSGFLSGHEILLEGQEPELQAPRWLAISGAVLADVPAATPVQTRLLNGDALAALELSRDGRTAMITFADREYHDVPLAWVSEVVRLRRNDPIGGRSRLLLESDLEHAYLPRTVRINANVAPASQGDSKQMQVQAEILGSGDSSRPFQRFMLRQKPLTYVSAATPSGTDSTLDIRIDGVFWHEAPRLGELLPEDRSYLVRRSDDGSVTVQFGDGIHGARLPSGQMNVEARYRVGIGAAGNVEQGQISLLMSRPLGLKEVINPVAASGGTDPENRDRARRNAPLTVLTLDRIVSLRDFEDFAAAFTGIGKAQAAWLWSGEGRLVHLTVIGVDSAPLDPASTLKYLAAAIDAVRPAFQPLRLEPGDMLRFGLSAKVRIDPDYVTEKVLADVRTALEMAFGFAARDYGQSLSGSEVLAVIQGVDGVDRVDLDSLRLLSNGSVSTVAGPGGRLQAHRARWQGSQILPAQLLLLDPGDVLLTELSA